MKIKILSCLVLALLFGTCSNKSSEFLKKLKEAKGGDSYVELQVGRAYYLGYGVRRNHRNAIQSIRKGLLVKVSAPF